MKRLIRTKEILIHFCLETTSYIQQLIRTYLQQSTIFCAKLTICQSIPISFSDASEEVHVPLPLSVSLRSIIMHHQTIRLVISFLSPSPPVSLSVSFFLIFFLSCWSLLLLYLRRFDNSFPSCHRKCLCDYHLIYM